MARRPQKIVVASFVALDKIAADLRLSDPQRKFDVAWGTTLHNQYVEWKRRNPDGMGEYQQAYAEITVWAEARKFKRGKSKARSGAQGILAFYEERGHLILDGKGLRILQPDVTRVEWDEWDRFDQKEFEKQQAARIEKRIMYEDVRPRFRGPRDTLARVMRDDFAWFDRAVFDAESEDQEEDCKRLHEGS